MTIPQRVFSRLACPDCHSQLRQENRYRLKCSHCKRLFPVSVNGTIPILYHKLSEFAHREKEYRSVEAVRAPTPQGRVARLLPKIPSTDDLARNVLSRFLDGTRNRTVLNLGSGEIKRFANEQWINFDVALYSNVHVVGDGHALPLKDGTFSGVYCTSVLEHVHGPLLVANEMFRILSPDGLVWVTVPLAYPIHGAADYFRFTEDGLRGLFHKFKIEEIGPVKGPFSVIRHYAERAAATLGGRKGAIARIAVAWILNPLVRLDPRIVKHNPKAASAYYLLARKSI